MPKIRLTKNEFKKQKDALKMYKRYLPTLQLKKQQLQMEIRGIQARAAHLAVERERLLEQFQNWVAVFGESTALQNPDCGWILSLERVQVESDNIAGVEIPVFRQAEFRTDDYSLFARPLWVDRAIAHLRDILSLDIEIKILEEQIIRLEHELLITTQRANLFEKVKIPETTENIRKIHIYLGDQQTAQVVRGKIAKNKMIERTAS